MSRVNSMFVQMVLVIVIAFVAPRAACGQNTGTVQATRTLGAEQNNRPDQPAAKSGSSPSPQEARTLAANQEEIRKKVALLYELAGQLKTEVDSTSTDKVLSTTLVKKAQEIEKLAKDIKNRSKS
jgi:hypothetical protein